MLSATSSSANIRNARFSLGVLVLVILFPYILKLCWGDQKNPSLLFYSHFEVRNVDFKKSPSFAALPNDYWLFIQDGLFRLYTSTQDIIVFSADRLAVRQKALAELKATPDIPGYTIKDNVLLVNRKALEAGIDIYAKRIVWNYLFSPCYILLCGLLILFLRRWNEFRKKEKHAFQFNDTTFLIVFFCAAGAAFLLNGLMQIKSPIWTADSFGYIQMSLENPIVTPLSTIRTPGVPCFLAFVNLFSPINYYVFPWQYGLYLFSIGFLLYWLCKFKFPPFLLISTYILFNNYMFDYHNALLAESLNLSGIILLCAMTLLLGKLLTTRSEKWKIAGAYFLTGIICFSQLMVKPFPGSILLVPSLLGSVLLLNRYKIKKSLAAVSVAFLICLLPAVLFCSYRWYKFGNFNFASLANVSLAVQNIVMSGKEVFQNDKISPSTKALIQEVVAYNNTKFPDFQWPIDFSKGTVDNGKFTMMVNRIWFHGPLIQIISRQFSPEMRKIPEAVRIDNFFAPIAKELMPSVPLKNRYVVLVSYFNSLSILLTAPHRLHIPHTIMLFFPFSSCWRLVVWFLIPLLILCIGQAAFWKYRWKSYMPGNMIVPICILSAIMVFSSVLILLTFCAISPFCEWRRELIALWGIFSGGILLLFYVWYGIVCLFGDFVSFISRMIRKSERKN